MITDSAVTVAVGSIPKNAEKLLDYTQRALDCGGIGELRDGVRVGDISSAIGAQLELGGLKVIDTLGGHGVGHTVHEIRYRQFWHERYWRNTTSGHDNSSRANCKLGYA